MSQPAPRRRPPAANLVPEMELPALIIAAVLLLGALSLHLLPALFAGMLAFLLIHVLSERINHHFVSARGKPIALGLITLLVMALLGGMAFGVVHLLKADAGMAGLFQKMASILDDASSALPADIASSLPSGADAVRDWLSHWLRSHASEMQLAGKTVALALTHVLIGMVIGSLLAFHEVSASTPPKPLASSLLLRVSRFRQAFAKVVFAQVRISLINTAFSALYLAVVLPLCGIQLPFIKTMIALTFLFGLLPVVGNLISNSIIIIVSLSHSLQSAGISLLFLISIHKAEYFLNARIVGNQIKAHAWELLLAMLVMESLFGFSGIAAAPVYYAYLKAELRERGLI